MFTSSRLSFTLITHDDFKDVHGTLNDRNTCDMLSFMQWPLTDEQVHYWCEKAESAAHPKQEYLFIARNKNIAVGCIGVHKNADTPQKAEVGYWVSPAHQRQGYAHEMLSSALHFAQEHLNISQFYATADNANPASAKLLIKNGFSENGDIIVDSANNPPRPSKLFTR